MGFFVPHWNDEEGFETMDMKQWVKDQIAAPKKKPLPVLTFPAAQKMGITTKELIYSPEYQAEAMLYIHDKTDMAAVLAFMDLSVEAEMFGSNIRYSDDEVPTVVGSIVDEDSDPDELVVPNPREGRTGVCIEGVRRIAEMVSDKPIIAGNIGPFSLAGRLMDVNEVMYLCYDEPELVHAVLNKVTDFIIDYTKALKEAGADGVLMAEPLAGLLSPDLTEEFSNPYVKRIVDETQDDEFIVIVHNCGSSVTHTIDSIVATGAAGYHLGNAIDMAEMMPHIPEDVLCFGNIDPASQFRHGTPDSVYAASIDLLERCSKYPNFILSSGCDIPQLSPWENIDAFFKAVDDFYAETIDTEAAATPAPVVTGVAAMSSCERFYAAIEHKPVDRMPVYSMVAGTNRVFAGADMVKWSHDAETCARGYIEFAKLVPEQDMIIAAIDFSIEAEAWGQKFIYTGNNPGLPDYSQMLIKTGDDYGTIQTVDASSAERMLMMVDVCKRLVAEFKGQKPIFAYVLGPLAVLSELRGQTQIKRDFAKHADEIRTAAENVEKTLAQFADMLMETGIDGIMWDAYFAGGRGMTRELWRQIEFDSFARLCEGVRAKGGINMVHSCQSRSYFDLIIEACKPEVISFFYPADGCETLAETKQKYGDQVTLMGAVTPFNSVFGTDLEWDEECMDSIDQLAGETGFILAPGCWYPANASFGRAKRMVDIAVASQNHR